MTDQKAGKRALTPFLLYANRYEGLVASRILPLASCSRTARLMAFTTLCGDPVVSCRISRRR